MTLKYFFHSAIQFTCDDVIRANPEDFCAKISANGVACKTMHYGAQITI